MIDYDTAAHRRGLADGDSRALFPEGRHDKGYPKPALVSDIETAKRLRAEAADLFKAFGEYVNAHRHGLHPEADGMLEAIGDFSGKLGDLISAGINLVDMAAKLRALHVEGK